MNRDVFLVEDCGNRPGHIYGVFSSRCKAQKFVDQEAISQCNIYKRKLWQEVPKPGLLDARQEVGKNL